MEYGEFIAWLGVMRKQSEPVTVGPDSWQGVENDSWWAEGRRARDQARAER